MEGFTFNYSPCGEDIIVLAGDIHTHERHRGIINQIPEQTPIVFVAGNHEYYRGEFNNVNLNLKKLEQEFSNFHFLNNESKIIGEVNFFGGTMFSDFKLYGESHEFLYSQHAQKGINDFHVITKFVDDEFIKWTTDDHVKQHSIFRRELTEWLASCEQNSSFPMCVVSHFVPHENAIHRRYKVSESDRILNPYFTSDMSKFMGWKGAWLFGHTHDSSDFMCGETRVVGNPKGYGRENESHFDPNLIIEI